MIEITVPADEVAPGRVFVAYPAIVLEVGRLAAHGRQRTIPFIWVRGAAPAAFEAAADDPTIADLKPLEVAEDTGLYVVDWAGDVGAFVEAVIDRDGGDCP